jgi:hypothetical protein
MDRETLVPGFPYAEGKGALPADCSNPSVANRIQSLSSWLPPRVPPSIFRAQPLKQVLKRVVIART